MCRAISGPATAPGHAATARARDRSPSGSSRAQVRVRERAAEVAAAFASRASSLPAPRSVARLEQRRRRSSRGSSSSRTSGRRAARASVSASPPLLVELGHDVVEQQHRRRSASTSSTTSTSASFHASAIVRCWPCEANVRASLPVDRRTQTSSRCGPTSVICRAPLLAPGAGDLVPHRLRGLRRRHVRLQAIPSEPARVLVRDLEPLAAASSRVGRRRALGDACAAAAPGASSSAAPERRRAARPRAPAPASVRRRPSAARSAAAPPARSPAAAPRTPATAARPGRRSPRAAARRPLHELEVVRREGHRRQPPGDVATRGASRLPVHASSAAARSSTARARPRAARSPSARSLDDRGAGLAPPADEVLPVRAAERARRGQRAGSPRSRSSCPTAFGPTRTVSSGPGSTSNALVVAEVTAARAVEIAHAAGASPSRGGRA